jgi:hypothetical protein
MLLCLVLEGFSDFCFAFRSSLLLFIHIQATVKEVIILCNKFEYPMKLGIIFINNILTSFTRKTHPNLPAFRPIHQVMKEE